MQNETSTAKHFNAGDHKGDEWGEGTGDGNELPDCAAETRKNEDLRCAGDQEQYTNAYPNECSGELKDFNSVRASGMIILDDG